jgi:hypothetical protein
MIAHSVNDIVGTGVRAAQRRYDCSASFSHLPPKTHPFAVIEIRYNKGINVDCAD